MTEEGVRLNDLKGRPVLAVDSGRELARVVQALFHPRSLRLEGLLCELTEPPATSNDDVDASAGPYRLLGLSDLLAIGPHAVTVASAASLNIPTVRPPLASLVDWERLLVNDQGQMVQMVSVQRPRSLIELLTSRPATGSRHRRRMGARAYGVLTGTPGTTASPPPLDLEQLPILTDQGEKIGQLQDVLVDPKSGRLTGLLMRELGFLRRFRSPILIPAAQVRSLGADACIIRAASSDTTT